MDGGLRFLDGRINLSGRNLEINGFLKTAGWDKADRTPVPGDASTRRYERLVMAGQRAVLMDAPKGAETPSEPDGASQADRKALGYNALARLAGPNPEAFAAIASELHLRGFSAPKIIAADLEAGLMLLEDLGDDLFARVIEHDPSQEDKLYKAAIDTLAAIYRSTFPETMSFKDHIWRVREYDTAALQAEADLFLEWFVPDFGIELSQTAIDQWHTIWADLFKHLDAHAPGLALRDFHAENLFWLPERQATARVGLIDFQDGLFAHPAYDLVSLLEDARRDVPHELALSMKTRFCEKAGIKDDTSFSQAYTVMSAQRNAKILGIFVRLAKRDHKPKYRDLIPRVAKLFTASLKDPSLKPLAEWTQTYLPDLYTLSHTIKTAMVLAAGHGTRMRPLTNSRSKAMVEVGGKPLIDHMLDRLASAGVQQAIVNVHAHADHLEAHLLSRTDKPDIVISDERTELLETGGGVVKALPLLGNDPVFICNIDAIWDEQDIPNLQSLTQKWDPRFMDDLLLLAPREETLGYAGKGDFDLSGGQISRRKGDSAPFVYAGVQIARLEPIKNFPCEPFSRNKVWDVSLKKGRAYGHVMDTFWMHVGDPDARNAAEDRLEKSRCERS